MSDTPWGGMSIAAAGRFFEAERAPWKNPLLLSHAVTVVARAGASGPKGRMNIAKGEALVAGRKSDKS